MRWALFVAVMAVGQLAHGQESSSTVEVESNQMRTSARHLGSPVFVSTRALDHFGRGTVVAWDQDGRLRVLVSYGYRTPNGTSRANSFVANGTYVGSSHAESRGQLSRSAKAGGKIVGNGAGTVFANGQHDPSGSSQATATGRSSTAQ